jgi:hypothetical protein
VAAVSTRYEQATARTCLSDILARSDNGALQAAAEEASAGPLARARRIAAHAHTMLAEYVPSAAREAAHVPPGPDAREAWRLRLEGVLRAGWGDGPRVTFGFLGCPLCRGPFPALGGALEPLLAPLRALRAEVEGMALKRVAVEGLWPPRADGKGGRGDLFQHGGRQAGFAARLLDAAQAPWRCGATSRKMVGQENRGAPCRFHPAICRWISPRGISAPGSCGPKGPA